MLALIALAAALVPVIGWLDRGIDLTDEGYYLLGYRHPRDVFLTLSHFQPLVAALTGQRPWPILFYRILGLALALATPAVFALQLRRFDRAGVSGRDVERGITLAAFTALGGLLCYTVGPRTLSYNGLSNACMLVEVGLALLLLSTNAAATPTRSTAAVLLGMVLGAHFVIKATSAGMMGFWLVGAGALLGLGGPRRWLATGAAAALGATLFGAAFFGLIVPPGEWWMGITICRSALGAVYSPAALAVSSVAPLIGQLKLAGPALLLGVGLVLAGTRALKRGRPWLGGACFVPGLFITLFTTLDSGVFSGSIKRGLHGGTPFAMLLALATTVWLSARARAGPRTQALAPPRQRARLIALLLPLPLLAALGTNNALSIQVLLHLAPWFAALWLMAEDLQAGRGRAWIQSIAVAAALIAIVEIGGSQLVDPYRLPGGIEAQVEKFSPRIEAGRGIWVDAGTRQLVEDTRDLLDRNGFRPGDPVFAFYDLPGLVHLVGGRSPMLPWFFSGSDPLACRAITLARDEISRSRVFVLARAELPRQVSASLDEAGMHGELKSLGTVKNLGFGDLRVFGHAPLPPQ